MSEEEQIILPDGFKRVEFLQSEGNEYLYLPDLTISSNDTIEWKQKLIRNISYLDGVFSSYNYEEKPFRFAANYSSNVLMINLFSSANHPSLNYYKSGSNFILSKNKLIIDNKTISENLNFKDDEVTGICIFTQRINGTYYNSLIQLYYWEVKGKCKLIPCLDADGNPCMYDLVSQKPFYNQGTGKFLTNKDYEWNYPPINNNYNLPSGFRKCVYLQSDGTQYIDLDVYPNNETGLLIKAMAIGEANGCPMGSNNTAPYIYPPRKILSSNKQIAYAWNNWDITSILLNWDKAGDLEYTSFVNYFNSRMVYFNSEDSDIIKSMNSDILPQLETNVRLFNWSVESSMLRSPWIGRIYRAQITQGDALIHDYVPCLDANNRPCMYDLIEQEALYNQSGGTEFAYCLEHQLPSDFVKLKYLEASGTQFIKTGYVPTNNTGLYIDAYCVIDSGTNGVQSSIPMSIRQTNGNTYVSAPRLGKTSSYQTGYGWNSFTSVGGYGDSRYEGYLNWLNNKKYNVKSPLYAEKVGNLADLSFTPSFDLCMFGNHNYDGKYVGSGYRIYRAKISEGSEIVRDYVPAYDQKKTKPCMYDLINNIAYYNDGEGEFKYDNRMEGSYTGYSGLGCIGNRLGGYYPQT